MDSIIFLNELEFRKYILLNIKEIDKIFVSLDILENIIYFYCLISNELLLGTKEHTNDFSHYNEIYQDLAKIFNLNVEINTETKILRLIKK